MTPVMCITKWIIVTAESTYQSMRLTDTLVPDPSMMKSGEQLTADI
jgi:hypothetical protein